MRQVEARPDAASRLPARPAVAFTKTFHTCVGLVFANAGRRRKVAVAQLSSNQLFGVQNQFPSFMANTHRLLSRKDCEYYLKRLDALPKKFDQLLENLKIREQKQILPPRFVVEEVLKEMTDFIGTPASENILASSFKTRAAKIAELSEAQRGDFQGRVETAISGRVYPAYQKLIDYFREILPKTTSEDGVWKLPNGNAYYAYCLRENTTTMLNPDEV